jgi:hypothetical protein
MHTVKTWTVSAVWEVLMLKGVHGTGRLVAQGIRINTSPESYRHVD